MIFAYPYLFLLLPLLGLRAFWTWRKLQRSVALELSSRQLFSQLKPLAPWPRYVPLILRSALCLSLMIASARPQKIIGELSRSTEGLDMMLVIDTSMSMLAMDFEWQGERVDRLTLVKQVVSEFIDKRKDDRIGLVVFGSQAFTQAPLTLDHRALQQFIKPMSIGMAGQETAIGDGLAAAVKRLKDLDAPTKVIILLSDGSNTAGQIDPRVAKEAAQALGVKVYTIGIGSDKPVPFPVQGFFGTEYRRQVFKVDRELLGEIAKDTGGRFFMASDAEALGRIYETIDQLEKTKQEWVDHRPRIEWAWPFLLLALIFWLAEGLWAHSRWRVLP